MRQAPFVARYRAEWQALERCLRDRRADCPDLPHRYRRVCQQLALARRRGYASHLQERLGQLVLLGHQRLYRPRRPLLPAIGRFFTRGLPRRARAEWPFIAVSAALFFGSLLAMLVGVLLRPELAETLLDPAELARMADMYDPAGALQRVGREDAAASDLLMFGYYLRNNTGIGFQTFAGGLPAGLGSVFFLLFNGLYIGAVAGYVSALGHLHSFWGFVAGHSAPELTAIVLSGAAGLRLGAALLAPGRRRRGPALRHAARPALELVYGAASLFFVAAGIEAFWSSRADLPFALKLAVGLALWALLLAWLLLAGRRRAT